MKRTLTLKKDRLTELTVDELASVVGGTHPITLTCTICNELSLRNC